MIKVLETIRCSKEVRERDDKIALIRSILRNELLPPLTELVLMYTGLEIERIVYDQLNPMTVCEYKFGQRVRGMLTEFPGCCMRHLQTIQSVWIETRHFS